MTSDRNVNSDLEDYQITNLIVALRTSSSQLSSSPYTAYCNQKGAARGEIKQVKESSIIDFKKLMIFKYIS